MSAFLGFLNPKEALSKAKSAALEALKLDDTLAEAHIVFGLVLGTYDFDWTGADREMRRALELNPASADVHYFNSALVLATGRLDEAVAEMRRALEQDPLSPRLNANLGCVYHCARQYDLASAQLQHTIELDPNYHTHILFSVLHVCTERPA